MRDFTQRKWFFFLITVSIIGLAGEAARIALAASSKKAYVIPVSGDVQPGMASFIQRAFRDLADGPDVLYILEMDTFGGRVDSALKIVDSLTEKRQGKTVAFITYKAISAGALISLACNDLVMKHNTTIGDCAPITYSSEGPEMLGEKFQSPLRAKFRALARRNNYPVTLAEAMVTAEMKVFRVELDGEIHYMDAGEFEDLTPDRKEKVTSKKTIVDEGELLTMDDVEARDLGFSRASVSDLQELLAHLEAADYEVVRLEESWSEDLVRFVGMISPILMMIGLAALYTEMQAPGFGAPGVIGILFLGLVFFNQHLAGMADHTELLIILLGLALLACEVFVIPGFGIAGYTGLFLIAFGFVLSLQDFVIPDPELPWEGELMLKNVAWMLVSCIGAFIISLSILRYVFPKLAVVGVKGPYLAATLEASHADSEEASGARVGQSGVAMTFLRPSGKAKIGGEIFDVITEGEFMEKGSPVTITRIEGNRVIVSRTIEI
ncbi:MAG: serine protease [Desulfobacterales bacterium]|nr:serine protease [Desulfobacterales bacterium]